MQALQHLTINKVAIFVNLVELVNIYGVARWGDIEGLHYHLMQHGHHWWGLEVCWWVAHTSMCGMLCAIGTSPPQQWGISPQMA